MGVWMLHWWSELFPSGIGRECVPGIDKEHNRG